MLLNPGHGIGCEKFQLDRKACRGTDIGVGPYALGGKGVIYIYHTAKRIYSSNPPWDTGLTALPPLAVVR